jgi:H/ACA ribonucleoprotein complex subunit 4
MSKKKTNLLPFERVSRKLIIKKEAETSDKFGKPPEDRSVSRLVKYGVVNIDKPKGPTSHQVSAYVQKIMRLSKAGHSGTLDPKVTGVLPIAFGRATRIVQALLSAGKEYVALMHLHKEIPEEKIRQACAKFIGKIKQLPPVKSSVKRQHRFRKVYYIDILEIDSQDVLFIVGTQAGTYIRKLIHDIGQDLGCGAHMAELRRTKAGPFREDSLVTLQDLSDAMHFYLNENNDRLVRHCIQPIENAAAHLPKIYAIDTAVNSLCHGASLKIPGVAKLESDICAEDLCGIYTLKGELVAIGKSRMTSKEIEKKEHGIVTTEMKVFMEPGVYPRIEQ